jgi:hypothetical protein
MKLARNFLSIISLVIANLVPLYGAVFEGWSIFSIIFLFWLESAIIGYFNIQKMKRVEEAEAEKKAEGQFFSASPFSLSMFFLMHYGIFMFVHLIFVLFLFFRFQVDFFGILIGFLGLVISHWISYKGNFLDHQEYLYISENRLLFQPYPRIIVMHLTLILGGFFVLSTGGAQWALGLMVTCKIIADLITHFALYSQSYRRLEFQ